MKTLLVKCVVIIVCKLGQGQLVTGIVLLVVGIHSCLQSREQLATGIHDEK